MAVFDLFKRIVGANAQAGDRRHVARVRASAGARVLVVDDSATIRAVLGKMLAQDSYEILKAADGESAVEMAQSQIPDLIFLDIVLPGMSGFAVLRALRRDSRTRTTPIIMMSGNQQATEQFYVQRFGADGFIKKPFGRAEVFHAIRSLVQAGRMPARVEAAPVDAIPEGMTPEEWNAIPDVAMPDDTHAPAVAEASVPDPGAPASVSAEVRADTSPEPTPAPTAPLESASPADVPGASGHTWSVPAASMPMQPSIGGGLRAFAEASPPTVPAPKPAPDADGNPPPGDGKT